MLDDEGKKLQVISYLFVFCRGGGGGGMGVQNIIHRDRIRVFILYEIY